MRNGRRFSWAAALCTVLALGAAGIWGLPRLLAPSIEVSETRLLHGNLAAQQAHQQGERAFASGNWSEAARGFETAARLEPRSAQALLNLAAAQQQLGREKDALASLEEVIRLQPKWGRAWAARAQLLLDGGRLDEARAAALRATSLSPRGVEGWLVAGKAALVQNDLPGAEAAARRATKVAPASALAWLSLGDVLLRFPGGKRASEAAGAFQQAATLEPGYYPRLRWGEALRSAGDSKGAVTVLEAAARLNPRDPGAPYQLSLALTSVGRSDDALVWGGRARRLQEQRYRLIALRRKVTETPDSAALQMELGRQLLQGGDREGASEAFRRVLALEPENRAARTCLAQLEAEPAAQAP